MLNTDKINGILQFNDSDCWNGLGAMRVAMAQAHKTLLNNAILGEYNA